MTTTRVETLSLTDGRELRVTIAEPDSAVRGGLVVLHEARGVTEGVRSLVSSLADEGWLAAELVAEPPPAAVLGAAVGALTESTSRGPPSPHSRARNEANPVVERDVIARSTAEFACTARVTSRLTVRVLAFVASESSTAPTAGALA